MLIDIYYHLKQQAVKMYNSKNRFKAIIQKLRENHHKITPRRLAIVNILSKDYGLPSVEDI